MSDSRHKPVPLVIYGDFNCPFSALASTRVAALERQGTAEVTWRSVQHDPGVPLQGDAVVGARRDDLERELAEIRTMLAVGEADRLRLPMKVTNTRLANGAYAAAPWYDRPALRERLFSAYWVDGLDLSDPKLIESIGSGRRALSIAQRWQEQWQSLPQPTVPALLASDTDISLGRDALTFLDHLAGGRRERPDLDSRSEIHNLVVHFYREVIFDDLLGPVFGQVARVDWSIHIPKLIDYWCRVLLNHADYDGYVLGPHQRVDELEPFSVELFDRWYLLFVSSVDERWRGPMAEKAKVHAARIAAMLARKVLGAEWHTPLGQR